MEINTLIAILAALLLMLLGLYVFKSKDSSSSENKKPRRRADIPNRDEDGQIIQGNLFKGIERILPFFPKQPVFSKALVFSNNFSLFQLGTKPTKQFWPCTYDFQFMKIYV